MKQRVISGIFIAFITVGVGWFGGPVIAAILLAAALIGFYELCRATGVVKDGKIINGLTGSGYLATILYYGGLMFGNTEFSLFAQKGVSVSAAINMFSLALIILTICAILSVYVLTFPRYQGTQVFTAVFSFLYCPVMLSFIYRARCLPYGRYIFAMIFFTTWINDTCAYFSGRAFGKHKMAPVLSPHKTIEGSIGGILGSTVLCGLLSGLLLWRHPEEPKAFIAVFIVIGVIGGFLGQIGDLAASAIKRNFGIKDYGKCIPGHGGIMDRFDSVIFVCPIIYFLAVLLLDFG